MKKLGRHLRTGDVITRFPGPPSGTAMPGSTRILLVRDQAGNDTRRTRAMYSVDLNAAEPLVYPRFIQPDGDYIVEQRPGELQADDVAVLTDAAQRLVDLHDSGDAGPDLLDDARRAALVELLDRLAPPVPPTMDEVLHALSETTIHARTCGAFNNCGAVIGEAADAILERARRAGILKGPKQ